MIFDCPACAAALRFDPATGKMKCFSCGNLYDTNEFSVKTDKQEQVSSASDESAATYSYSCPSCNNALKYDPSTGLLKCIKCNTLHDSHNFIHQKQTMHQTLTSEAEFNEFKETIECNVYSCTACGAEITVNGAESSTFCAYCGQPTIVFDRVSSMLKPKYIIPFSVTKERAVSLIRSHVSKGLFIPKAIKNFQVEQVRGIYIPFWLFDIDYFDKQTLSGQVSRGKKTVTRYFYREAECSFRRITLDASHQLNDESSQRLEPFDMSALKPFESSYLSGFYADRYDLNAEQIKSLAVSRAKELFDAEVVKTVRASHVSLVSNHARYTIKNSEYALFPAWFLTFRYQDDAFTILVNGQTGKVVGAVPYIPAPIYIIFVLLGLIFSAIASFLIYHILLYLDDENFFKLILIFFGAGFSLISYGWKKFRHVTNSILLTNSKTTHQFVKKRQEDY